MKVPLLGVLSALLCGVLITSGQNVRISEFMANNDRVLAAPDGEFPDWIEIQNADSVAVDLSGWYLTDNPLTLNKWQFPSITLPSGGFLVIFASGKNLASAPTNLHTSFQLNADGGFLALVKPDGTTIASSYSYPAVDEDEAFGMAQTETTTFLLPSATPQVLVPANQFELPPDWNQLSYVPGPTWTNGVAPPSIGFDTNQAVGAPVNVAPSGTAVQSTTLSSFSAASAIDNNFANFTHTAGADSSPFWQVTLTNRMAIFSVVLFNRTSCCGSRLRDITIEILATNESGTVTNYVSPLLNPENTGFAYPNGPGFLSNDLVTATGGPVSGNIVRVRRTPDPDLSGSGGQGNTDEPNVLSLGEVVVNASSGAGLRPFFRNDIQSLAFERNASAFLRVPFFPSETPDTLTMSVRHDDGFVAYLNGTEILRRNAPEALAWNSPATVDRNFAGAIAQEQVDISSAIPLLQSGANVIAVQVLNFSASNGDLLFDPVLTAVRRQITTNVFLVDATPGSANVTDWYFDEVDDTAFSVDRGFFEAPFSLSITSGTPDAVIYYSFNGNEPSPAKGTLYTGPITITNTTAVRARAFKTNWKPTDVDTHTYIFIADVIRQAANWETTRVPPTNFPASWGANAVDYGMDPDIVNRHTLAEWKEAFTQIPTMSIVTEIGNLFNPATGIYANATQHGIDWERPMSLELIDPNAAPMGQFQENCGLRIRGGFSRNPQFVKHSLRVFFRREYGAGRLRYPLFQDEGAQEFETFDLRTSQNYSWPRETSVANGSQDTMVREVFCRETLGVMGQPYRRSRYYHLYINGQYWGLYETDERPEASYGETYFGGQKENFDVVKCGNRGTTPNFITEATDGNLLAFSNLWTMTRSMVTNASNSNYFRIIGCNPDGTRNPGLPVMIDVDNLIDYMMGIFYTGDGDATLSAFLANNMPNNWFGMRDRTNPNVGFRFFNSDCEHTLGAPSWRDDRTGPFGGSNQGNFTFANPQWMHEELMLNAEYRLRFADRAQRHCFYDGAITPMAGTNRFLRKAAQITKAIRAYSARWGDAVTPAQPYGETHWKTAIDSIVSNWFPTRTSILLGQLRIDGLFPSNAAPEFSQRGGQVPAGFQLEMLHTNASGAIFYTLDGTDPRLVGGNVSGNAQSYSAPIPINGPTTVRARVLIGTTWSALVEHVFFPPQDLSKLLITELMYHPPGVGAIDSDEYEFVELKNAGTNTLSLAGLGFNGITYTFPASATLAPGQFYVIVRNAARFAEKYPGVAVNGTYSGRLDNGGERVTLSHVFGGRILSVSYDDDAPWPITPDEFGFSLVPRQPNENSDPDNPANWRASTFPGGSPGADDAAPTIAAVLINEVLSHSETGSDFIELFNPNAAAVDIGGWFLSDGAASPMKYRIPDGTFIAALSYLVFDESDFNPTPGTNNSFSLNAQGDDVFLFSGDANTNLTGYSHGFSFGAAPDQGTFGRYVISTGDEQFPAQISATPDAPNSGPRIGPVVINEIHYHPDSGGIEFIELKNISTNTVPLFDPDNTFNTWFLSGVAYEFPQDVYLAPNELILLTPTDPGTFRATFSVPAHVQILGPYLGVLQGSGERLELQRPDVPDTNGVAYITVDEVRYNDKSPWPIAADGSGPSLQRKNSAAYGNDPANWEAALPTPGAEFVGGQAPSITMQPQSHTAFIGQSATFTVVASGPAPLSYRWRFNGSDIPGATGTSLTISNVHMGNAGSYSVVVFNAAGSAASAIATLTVKQPPLITRQPAQQVVLLGENATFSVSATGNGFLRYQWLRDGTNLLGATNTALVISNAQFASEGSYRVVVTDSIGPAISDVALLLIKINPEFVEHPVGLSVVTGTTFTISATVTNNATLPLGFRQRRNNVTLNATHVTLNSRTVYFTILAERPFTNYAIIATNAALVSGRLSRPAFITLLDDSDGDGLPDSWENDYGPAASDRNGDADGDGASNWAEYIAGTDPTNALSYLKLELSADVNVAMLKFASPSNRTYTVEYTDDLASSPWMKLTDISTRLTNRVESIPDPNWRPSRFYRLVTPRKE